MRPSPLVVATVAVVAFAMSARHRQPLLVWNATASVPIGLYHVVDRIPLRGSLAVIRLPEPFRTFAHHREYVPASLPLIKPIVALRGDTLCRQGYVVSINNRPVALARKNDHAGRQLPTWRGCHQLSATAIAVISPHPDGFDSRYFGPIDIGHIIGLAIPVWTSTDTETPVH